MLIYTNNMSILHTVWPAYYEQNFDCLIEYCREEFEKFTTFLTSKSAKIGKFSGEIGQFSE